MEKSLRKALILLVLMLIASSAFAGTIPISGTFRGVDGSRITGRLVMTLNYPATDTCSGNIVAPMSKTFSINNGELPSNAAIVGNDCLAPANTFYVTQIFTSAGALVRQNNYYVAGAQFNLSTATPTALTSSNISFGTFTGLDLITAKNIDNVRMCDAFAGATAGAKIAACIADIPSTGGTADARGLQGAQTISVDVFSGVTKKVRLLLGSATYTVTVSQTMRDGQTIEGQGPINRWRSAVTCPSTLAYTGTGQALNIAPTAGTGRDSIVLYNLCLDGTGASGSVDGLRLNGSSGSGAYIEGFLAENVGIYNFPRYQVYATDTVFDVRFRSFTAHNSGRSANNIIEYEYLGSGGAASQWRFDDTWLSPYTTGKWGFFAGKTDSLTLNVISDVVFTDSTIAPYDNTNATDHGANGIWANGQIELKGVHCEGLPFNQPQTICVRYTGSNGLSITGSQMTFVGRGVELGNSGGELGGSARLSDEAINVNIPAGTIFNNNHCTVAGGAAWNCADIYVVQTGQRRGTFIEANSNITTNNTYFGTLTGQPRVVQAPAFALTTCTNATPIACTTSSNHGYSTGDAVIISDVGVNTAANAQWQITVTGAATFTLDGSVGNGSPTANTGIVSLINNDVHYCDYTAASGGVLRCSGIFYDAADRQIGINKMPVVTLDVLGTANDCVRLSDSSNSNRITSQICSTAGHQGQLLLNSSAEAARVQFDSNTNGGLGFMEPYLFTNLPAVSNGSFLICSDCAPASNPCTGSSTGTIALRIGGAWVCR